MKVKLLSQVPLATQSWSIWTMIANLPVQMQIALGVIFGISVIAFVYLVIKYSLPRLYQDSKMISIVQIVIIWLVSLELPFESITLGGVTAIFVVFLSSMVKHSV